MHMHTSYDMHVDRPGHDRLPVTTLELERGMVVLELAKTMLPDASTPPTRATEHVGTQRDINRQPIHTTHSLYSQYRFGANSRISAIATPALIAQAARKHAAHTTARSPARAHRGVPKSPSGSTLAARNPSIRSLVAAHASGTRGQTLVAWA